MRSELESLAGYKMYVVFEFGMAGELAEEFEEPCRVGGTCSLLKILDLELCWF